MTREDVLKNLQKLIGQKLATEDFTDEVIQAYEDFTEYGESYVYVEKSHNVGYDYVANIDSENATSFLISVCEDEDTITITDVTMY